MIETVNKTFREVEVLRDVRWQYVWHSGSEGEDPHHEIRKTASNASAHEINNIIRQSLCVLAQDPEKAEHAWLRAKPNWSRVNNLECLVGTLELFLRGRLTVVDYDYREDVTVCLRFLAHYLENWNA